MKSSVNPRIVIVPKIIGYCLSDDKKAALMDIAREINTNLNLVGVEAAGRLVGNLVGINGIPNDRENPAVPPAECEILIMSGLKNSTMDKFLKLLRERGATVDIKCVVTSENQNWRLYRLVEELKAEHEKFNK